MSEIERLRALLAGGTPGPWTVTEEGADEWWFGDGQAVVRAASATDHGSAVVVTGLPEGLPDTDLIAAAVNTLPALLDVAEAARAVAKFAPNTFETEAEAGFVFQGLLSILRTALDRLEEWEVFMDLWKHA